MVFSIKSLLKTRSCTSFFIFIGFVLLASCSQKPTELLITGPTMGTSFTVKAVNPPKTIQKDVLEKTIQSLLVDINQQMSTYIPDSEISRFNQAPIGEWFSVSPEFIEVLLLSQRLSELSKGKFDITIGPLISLWGFDYNSETKVPSQEEINLAKSKTGYQSLKIDTEARKILREKAITLNVSAVAKGYGADKLAEYLESLSIKNYLVEIGGEMRVAGKNSRGDFWRIGVEKPTLTQGSVQQIIALDDKAVATSGDYRNYFEENGIRYSHTIDPDQGKPVRHSIASVTVIAETAAEADGFATALNVLGKEAAMNLAEKEELAAYFILYTTDESDPYVIDYSSAFSPYLEVSKKAQ